MDPSPREEVDYTTLYGPFLSRTTRLNFELFDSRKLNQPVVCRLPFPPEKSGYSWRHRLDGAKDLLPRVSFRPTRPKGTPSTFTAVRVNSIDIPQKRGRGRPRKDPNTEIYKFGTPAVNEHSVESGINRPERHYFRNTNNNTICEYDLDDQDLEWLNLVNSRMFEKSPISEDLMEKLIEELELNWNSLTRPIRRFQQRKEASLYPEEMPCEICAESDTSNCNVIVLCDDCDLAVHQECYGIPHIPEGPWLCRPCSEKSANIKQQHQCLLCPWPGGALRKTSDYRWVHSLCASMVPETSTTFTPSDPDDLVDICTLPTDRAKLRCVLCRTDPEEDKDEITESRGTSGYPIQCGSKTCHVAFHAICARAAGWTIDFEHKKAFCCKHTPDDAEESVGSVKSSSPSKTKFPTVEISSIIPLHVPRVGEKLRLQSRIPKVILDHLITILPSEYSQESQRDIVRIISKYWALKRESRRGTPLLKSLQLEPCWSEAIPLSEAALLGEYEAKAKLARDLKKLKDFVFLLKGRESAKLKSNLAAFEKFEMVSRPFQVILLNFLDYLQRELDVPGYFAHPVPCDLFPDYRTFVPCPMDFSTLKSKVIESQSSPEIYPTLKDFYLDLKLIWENARIYNMESSVFYQAADRLEERSREILKKIAQNMLTMGIWGSGDIFKSFRETGDDFAVSETDEKTNFIFEKSPKPTGNFSSTESSHDSSNANCASNVVDVNVNVVVKKKRGRPPKNPNHQKTFSYSGSTSVESIESIESNESGEFTIKRNPEKIERRGRPKKIKRTTKRPTTSPPDAKEVEIESDFTEA